MSSPASTPDRRRVFTIYARFAYPANGYQGDRDLAAKHLVPGRTYVIDRLVVGRSRTTIYLHGFPGIGFNSVQFAPAWHDDEDEPGQVAGECEPAVLRDDNGLRLHVGLTQTGAAGISVTEGMRSTLICLSGERLAQFREALDRAAMPGQEGVPGE